MTADKWNGNGDWDLNPSDWSSGIPTPTTPAEIQSGTATISSGGFGEAQSLTIDGGAGVSLYDDASLNITDWLDNVGGWSVGGGDTVSIGTRLINSGAIDIGNNGITASTTVTAASLTNTSTGNITLQGNASSGTTDEATLDITGSNSATVSGTLSVLGDADLELVTGITNVSSTGYLRVDGQQARISIGAGLSSNALSGLTWNAGTVDFDGNSGSGYGGTSIATAAAFTNLASGQLLVDVSNGDGGSRVSFGGAFVNAGVADIGNSALGNNGSGGSTLVMAHSLNNIGALNLLGNAASATTHRAILDITGAAAATSTGRVQVGGAAALEFASGGITSIGYSAWLELDGSGAKILTSAGASSALSGLAANHGTLLLRGDSNLGSGGATLTTTTSFTNYGVAYLDGYLNGDGGSTAIFGGTLINYGTLDIGNVGLGASTRVTATALVDNATFNLQGNAASGTTDGASLILSGSAALTVTNYLRVGGDALLEFHAGGITTVVKSGWLELDGSGARILTNAGSSSALASLGTNDGVLLLRGNTNDGAGGARLATTTSLTNNGTIYVDAYQAYDSGSAATIGGALINNANFGVGNENMGASSAVFASTLSNNGSLTVQGNASSGTTDRASLILSGAAASISTGYVRVSGDGLLYYGSGGIATVGAGGWLELDGSEAQILTSGGSALAKLATNEGNLVLRGNTGEGAGGARLTTTTGLTNNGTMYVDGYQDYDSGSVATIGGTLINNDNLFIGNGNMGASTTVSATALSNDGSLTVQGNSSSGATARASLILSGAAAATSTDFVRVGGDGLIRYGSGGIATVGAGGWLELDGSEAQILTSGGSALAKLATNNGTLLLRGNTGLGAGGARLVTTTSLTNNGTMYVDSYQAFDSGSAATIGGTLINNENLSIGNENMGASSAVFASTLSNNGSLTVQGNASSGATDYAALLLSGAAASTSTGYVRAGGDALIRYGSGEITAIGAGSWLELDGSEAKILTSAGASSALATLATNEGTLVLRGNTGLGAGGAKLATTSGMTNYGTFDIDSYQNFDSGSVVAIGGALVNEGAFNIGNGNMGAATTVSVSSLSNDNSISLLGSSSFLAKLVVNGVANTDGSLSIGAGSELDVTGAHSFTQAGGSTTVAGSLVASAIYANDGLLDFQDAIISGGGVGALYIGGMGNLELGASVDSSHSVDFLSGLGGTLSLGDAVAFSGKIAGFSGHDAIDLLGQAIAGLSFSGGVLAVSLSGGGTENLDLSGSYTTSSFTSASDGHGGTNILHT